MCVNNTDRLEEHIPRSHMQCMCVKKTDIVAEDITYSHMQIAADSFAHTNHRSAAVADVAADAAWHEDADANSNQACEDPDSSAPVPLSDASGE